MIFDYQFIFLQFVVCALIYVWVTRLTRGHSTGP